MRFISVIILLQLSKVFAVNELVRSLSGELVRSSSQQLPTVINGLAGNIQVIAPVVSGITEYSETNSIVSAGSAVVTTIGTMFVSRQCGNIASFFTAAYGPLVSMVAGASANFACSILSNTLVDTIKEPKSVKFYDNNRFPDKYSAASSQSNIYVDDLERTVYKTRYYNPYGEKMTTAYIVDSGSVHIYGNNDEYVKKI